MEEEMESIKPPTWSLFVACSSRDTRSDVGMFLFSPEGHKQLCNKFRFKATNNVAKYDALLARLRLVRKMQAKMLVINSDSQLVVSQVNRNFAAINKNIAAYLKLVMELLLAFEKFELA